MVVTVLLYSYIHLLIQLVSDSTQFKSCIDIQIFYKYLSFQITILFSYFEFQIIFIKSLILIQKSINSNKAQQKLFGIFTMSGLRAYEVKDYDEIPVPHEDRIHTDFFCTVCSSIFAIVMFIVSFACLNTQNLSKMTYPNDIQGNLCGWDAQDYKMLYYTTVDDPTKRLCVRECPKAGDTQLKCYSTPQLSCSQNSDPKYQVNIYDTEMVINRLGIFCLPTDEEQRAKAEQMIGLYNKKRFLSTYDAMWNSLWLSFIFGTIFLALVQFFPSKVFNWTYLIGGIVFIVVGLLCLILAEGSIIFRLIAGIIMIILGGMVLAYVFREETRKQIIVGGKLFQCATQVVKTKYALIAYIPIFIILFVGLVFLIAFQLLAVWSSGKLIFKEDSPFYEVKSFLSSFLSFISFIEFLWGMSFLKQSFNFIVSGYATQWYYYSAIQPDRVSAKTSPKRLITKHWGSVVGGSFMLQFFYIPDLIVDYFFPTDIDKSHKKQSVIHSSALRSSMKKSHFNGETQKDPRPCHHCCEVFNLVRSEAMGYINIVSIPYCNASRYCEMLAEDSDFYDRSQTTNRLYRLSAHAILIALTCAFAFLIAKQHSGNNAIEGIIFCFMVALFMVTYFISFHGDIAEGILVSVFVEEKVTGPDRLERAPQCVKKVYNRDLDENDPLGNDAGNMGNFLC